MSDEILPNCLYRAEQVRELDRLAIEEFGIPGFTLMRRAGKACFRALLRHWPDARRLVVVCGGGNNAGDGYIIAGLAARQGLEVHLWQVGSASRLRGDARRAREWAIRRGVDPEKSLPEGPLDPVRDVVVDALLGTGLSGSVRAAQREAIEAMNGAGAPVVAVDIPSGLSADTGMPLGAAVRADLTVSFIGLKQGLFTGSGPAFAGRVEFEPLKVPAEVYARVPCEVRRIVPDTFMHHLAPRARDAHKGDFGHVLVVGGDHGMAGAVAMAGEAAARSGAGLVSIATRGEHVAAILARRPEIMVRGIQSAPDLGPLLERATVLVVGPGLGRSAWSTQVFQQAVEAGLPMVVDADALNFIARGEVVPEWRGPGCILTPHPGEAARLLGCSIADVQADRFAAVRGMQARFGATVLLKGAGTLVCSGEGPLALCDRGNPGMAGGGMGDVLGGLLGGLLAQGIPAPEAAAAGAWLHGACADQAAAATGERGLLATDLLPYLHRLVNP